MKIHKNTILRLLYEPKKLLLSPTVITCSVVSLIAGGLVYINQRGVQKESAEQTVAVLDHMDAGYSKNITAMQKHIASLNSRIEHLSTDNKRLSATGQKLSQQLRSTSSNIKEQIAHNKELQLELYALDQHLIHKYDYFIEQQKTVAEAKIVCERDKEKDRDKDKNKSKKCMIYNQARQGIEDLVSQIKFLKAKREVLMSEIERSDNGI